MVYLEGWRWAPILEGSHTQVRPKAMSMWDPSQDDGSSFSVQPHGN